MPSLDEMASKGQRKFTSKAPTMKANYDAAKSRAKTNFNALPFGPNTKSAYSRGIDAAVYRTPDPSKWRTNWVAAVSR